MRLSYYSKLWRQRNVDPSHESNPGPLGYDASALIARPGRYIINYWLINDVNVIDVRKPVYHKKLEPFINKL